MSKINAPLKRSKELAPLSREHHDGLQFVWKIRQGLTNETNVDLIAQYVRWFWQNHIKPHFADEEKVLTQYLPSSHPYIKQMADEHAQIRDQILHIDREADGESLNKLADFIYNHIRFEERELFQYAEKTLTAEQLQEIHKQLEDEHVCNTEWTNEFWLKK